MEFYETTKKLDLRSAICPSTFSKTKQALTEMGSGDILQVRLNSGEHMENVPPAVLNLGHQVLDIIKDGNSYLLYIMKQ
ncbi:MAG: sulfurtransferase TusA family protein [Deltaproteobacteria bacterium]|nr:sulfurtransferase TusA family protein [Deltaproteobacteria bacterium]